MNTVRRVRSSLPLLALSFLSMMLVARSSPGAPQTATPPQPPGQGGNIQMPMRVCDLHDFDLTLHEPNGLGPIGAMVQGPPGDDSFYSASEFGGTHNMGTIYKVTVTRGVANVTVLYNFGDDALRDGGRRDGGGPKGGLSLGRDGTLYGTTAYGGKFDVGTVFKIAPADGAPTLLYSFRNGTPDPPVKGQPPPPPLTQQQKDDLAAAVPWSAPLLGQDGNLYGVTTVGETFDTGVLYQLTPGGVLKCIHRFRSAEQADFGLFAVSLSRGWDGNFYGTTLAGGLKFGTVFEFNPSNASAPGGGVRTIYRFNPLQDGADSWGVIQGFDRNLYGTLYAGGKNGRGVLFRLTLNGTFTSLHAFGGTDSRPGPGVVEVLQNDPIEKGQRSYYLYGAASSNASIATRFNSGILYRRREQEYPEKANQGKEFSVVYNVESFNGATPSTTPVLGRDSYLYGTMAGGGAHLEGVFYSLNTKYEVSGDSGTFRFPTDASGVSHQNVVFMGDPGGKSVIYDDRSPIQVVTHMAGFQPAATDASKATTSDGITVRAKDIPPYAFWPRPNALQDRAKFVQFFYRERIDSSNKPIAGVTEQYNSKHSYSTGETARFNGYLWLSKSSGNIGHVPPLDQDCVASQSGCTDANWAPAYWYTDPKPPHATLMGSCMPSEIKQYNCTLVSRCSVIASLRVPSPTDSPDQMNTYGDGYQCIPLTANEADPRWVVDAQGHMTDPSMSTKIDPFYSPIDTQVDCDGVTLFDSPTLAQNNPDETQKFTALDYVIIDRKVVMEVIWTLQAKPKQAEEYGAPYVGGPRSPTEQACFADMLSYYNFDVPFDVPGNVKCPTPLYAP